MVLLETSTETQQVDVLAGYSSADTSITLELLRELPSTVRKKVQQRNAARGAGPEGANKPTQEASSGYGQEAGEPIVGFPTIPERVAQSSSLPALQEWEGYVLAIRRTDFLARLVDLTTGSSHAGEEAEIPKTELSDEDNGRLREGSIFRWVIGYERSAAGTKKRVSQIVLRDLPVVTKGDLARSEAWAQDMARTLDP